MAGDSSTLFAMRIEPADFDETNADPETLALNEQLERLTRRLPDPVEVGIGPVRETQKQGRGLFGPAVYSDLAENRTIRGPAGELGIRVFIADRVDGIYLHFHGGGWALGSASDRDSRLEAIARNSGVAVVSVDYRLAPEHPYPAASDDAEAAALWVVEAGADVFGTDRIVTGGESAGAHLAATAMLRLRDRHGFTGFAGAVFVYGFFDLALTASARNWGERPLVLNTDTCRWFAETYAAGADVADPDVSPLYADLTGLPPTLIVIGTQDPLLDDSLIMGARLVTAGSDAELHVATGAAHGFTSSSIPASDRAKAAIQDWIQRCVAEARTDRSPVVSTESRAPVAGSL
ncbi:MAG: alpha/beta hydrolase [Acidimicrobiia bacterium]|nr:MAG: alpha/beta hydrolase [Acidimicrobiia bacterium]